MKPKAPSNNPNKSGAGPLKVETSAGGIVFKRTPRGVRVALLLDPYAKWSFAKGHVEPGESLQAAAVRETREEMGLGRLRVVAPLGRIELWFRDRYRPASRGMLIHKFVHYFLLEAPAHAQGRPQAKEKIQKLIWTDVDQVMRLSGYRDVRPMLARVQEFFRHDRRSPVANGPFLAVSDVPPPTTAANRQPTRRRNHRQSRI